MKERVAVFVCFNNTISDQKVLDFITYGIEEEGIPFHLEASENKDFKELATIASRESQLDVGIGLDSNGNMCLHHAMLPESFYLFEENHSNNRIKLRNIGVNAARLVKGIPFKIEEML